MSFIINDIKTPNDIGIKSLNTFDTLQNNLKSIDQYANAALSGKSDVLKTNNTPYGQRYFLNTTMQCEKYQETGYTDRYILVDNKKYKKFSNGTLDTNNYGLLYSAEGSLQEVDSNSMVTNDNLKFDPNANINKCVPVTIILDDNNNTDTKYVTIKDCKRIDSIAFKNGTSTCPNIEGFESIEKNNITNSDELYKVTIEDDSFTRLYFSSIVVVGLFILYRFFEKTK